MEKKIEKRLYEPPQAMDLSDIGVNGDSTDGNCSAGPFPYYDCVNGPLYSLECTPGSTVDTSVCQPMGLYHTAPGCKPGQVAATLCFSGSGQNF